MIVRRARIEDAERASAVLVASITGLCSADHAGDPGRIANWTANKGVDSVRRMIAHPGVRMFVAEIDGDVAAVGCINPDQKIGLNYVDPAYRWMGASTALLAAMEAELGARGMLEAELDSTATALDFYHARGWTDAGAPVSFGGMLSYPLSKRL